MSELNSPTPQLSLNPQVPEPAPSEPVQSIQQQPAAPAAPAPETAVPMLDDSQLTEAERKAIDDFIGKIDITNPQHVLLFGADAQKRIADFSESALETVKTQDTGEVGDMLVNLVSELKGFERDTEEPKGLRKLFARAEDKVERMKARYGEVSATVENIAGSLCNAAKALVEVGGAKHVYACASHGVLSGPAIDRINSSDIQELALLDTIPAIDPALSDRIKYLTVAPMFCEAIERIYQEVSISKLFR